MSQFGSDFGGQIRQHSGWLIPLALLAVTAGLAAIVLAYYFAPTAPELINEQPAPTNSEHKIALSVGAMELRIPGNYILFESARKGGPHRVVRLMAVLPELRGYSASDAQALAANAEDSEFIFLRLMVDNNNLSEAERLERVYLPQVVSRAGTQGPFGLRQYQFPLDTGYRSDDLFVGASVAGAMALRCTQRSQLAPSPNCLREMLIAPNVSLTYRFKRAHLAQWKEIDASVRKLIASFIRKPHRVP